jgi:hypothetical protein
MRHSGGGSMLSARAIVAAVERNRKTSKLNSAIGGIGSWTPVRA